MLVIFCEFYGNNVESFDLLVGLLVEKKFLGFVISEIVFVIFVFMVFRWWCIWCLNFILWVYRSDVDLY